MSGRVVAAAGARDASAPRVVTGGAQGASTLAGVLALGAVVALTAGAFLLRVYRLDLQSLTGDEAFTMLVAQRWLSGQMSLYSDGGFEPTPPLFFVLMHFWTLATGYTEFAARYFSVAASVLVVPTAYAFGRRLEGRRLGLVFAALVAANPFLISHAQSARFYSMTAWLVALSGLCLVRLLDTLASPVSADENRGAFRHRFLWLAYVVTTLLLLYTNSFAVLLIAAHNAAFLLSGGVRRRWRPWLAGQAGIALAYLPWAIWAYQLLLSPLGIWTERGTVPELLARVLSSFVLGGATALPLGLGPIRFAPDGHAAGALVAFSLLLFAIGASAGRSAKGRAGRISFMYLVVPLTIAVALAVKTVLLRDRYMMPFLPGYLLGIAAGITEISRGRGRLWIGLAALAVALIPAVASLPPYYRTTVFATSGQVRDLRAYVAREARPDAAVIVNLPSSDPFFQYYSLGRPTLFISDARPADRASGLPALVDLTARSGEIWLLPFGYGDQANHFVEGYLGSTGFKTEERWFGNLRLVRYSIATSGAGPRHDLDAAATLVHPNGRVRLAGYRLAPEPARPGDVLTVSLYWQPDGPLAARYKVFVHLDDASGKTRAQRDAEPLSGQRPTTGWRAGEEIADNYGLALPADLPPGEYRLDIGLYAMDGGERLLLPNGENHLVVATVAVHR